MKIALTALVLLPLLSGCTAGTRVPIAPAAPPSTPASPQLQADDRPLVDVLGSPMILTSAGYSAIRIGGRLGDVRGGYSFAGSPHNSSACGLFSTPEVPGLLLYVQQGRITRVSIMHVRLSAYIHVPPAVRTDRGIAVGASEAEVRTAYPEAIDTPPDVYSPAGYRWVPVRRQPRYDGFALAAKEVGLSRESAYKLRRSAHGAAFARAWDAARHHAGSFLEDVAFERAVEGVEHNVYNEYGEAVCTKRVYNDRLLMFLLRHLKPERYGKAASATPGPPITVEGELRAMEPPLPAPPEQLLDCDTLQGELEIADICVGALPHSCANSARPNRPSGRRRRRGSPK